MSGSDALAGTAPRRAPRPHLAWKWWLFILHRWIGIASCLLFVMWFASGLVMLHVPYPALTAAERLAGLQPIDWDAVRTPPPAGRQFAILEMTDGVPVWRVSGPDGRERAVPAGVRPPPPVDRAAALRIAGRFAGRDAVRADLLPRDQWTVAGGYNRHRPLWQVALAGDDGLTLYVSSTTGAVVLDTTRRERFWNWLGSVPHWLYPTVLRQDQPLWRQTVIWVCLPCVAGALTGMWIGILRMRLGRRRFSGGRTTPYQGWLLWHHVAGLVGGVFLTAWIISGWLSVDPGRLFDSPGISAAAERSYARPGVPPSLPVAQLAARAPDARQASLLWFAARPLVVVPRGQGSALVLDARTGAPASVTPAQVRAAGAGLVPGGTLRRVEWLTAPDAYWYAVRGAPRLPVLRLRFDDPQRTWVHVDARSGEILDSQDARRRLYRWAFDLLHRWDLNLLTAARPARELLIWALSAAGLIVSASGVTIGWRRLRRTRPSGDPGPAS